MEPAVIIHCELSQIFNTQKVQQKIIKRIPHLAKAFGIKNLCLIDVDNLGLEEWGFDAELNIKYAKNLNEALSYYPDLEPVYVEQGSDTYLNDFQHPYDAVYIFGADYGQLPKATISIPSDIALYVDDVMAIVLYDRYISI